MNNRYQLDVLLDLDKYADDCHHIGRAEEIIRILLRELKQAHVELRQAKRDRKFALMAGVR